jgi:glycosyltransferase involved in cell wall biosynthesis
MAGESQAEGLIRSLGIQNAVELLPKVPREAMAALFRKSNITVSLTTHDGTPNSLLEAMACGSFPIAGDLESVREWIEPGVNGLLVDPTDPRAVAAAILQASERRDLRQAARERNLELIQRRAEYNQVMHAAEDFYQKVI